MRMARHGMEGEPVRPGGARVGRLGVPLRVLLLGALWSVLPLGSGTAQAFSQTTIASPDGMTPPEPPQGGIRWALLKEVDEAIDPATLRPKFGRNLLALDGKEVKLRGFILPIEQTERQRHFVLTALPPSCPFCLPAGPDQLVEIECTDAVKFTFDPVTIAGRFQVLRDDPTGMLYRISDAKRVDP